MFVVFQNPFSLLIKNNIYSIYEMRMDGLGERKLLKDELKGIISMCYDRDSKTLFVSDERTGFIWSYSNKGLHYSFFKF